MSLVGFGKQEKSDGDGAGAIPDGHALSLVAAIYAVVMHLPHILLLPKWALKRAVPHAYEGYVELERYMAELLGQEKARLLRPSQTSGGEPDKSTEAARETLLTAVLRSNTRTKSKSEGTGTGAGTTTLTDMEIKGNVFMFLLAGYDTTANTMLYCCIVLTLYPAIQACIIDEVDRVWERAEAEGREELSFTHDMPKFRYLVAFMYEVMRVFPIVLPIARVASGPQELRIASTNKSHLLPSGTGVIVNNTAIHHDPGTWPHPAVIEPRRWLISDPHAFDPGAPHPPPPPSLSSVTQEEGVDRSSSNNSSSNSSSNSSNVRIPGHRRGAFMSFGEGPRACLGRNFARTEFVAFYSRLLRKYRLKLGEGVDAGQVERTIRLRSGGSPVTLVPPEDMRIDLVERA